MLRADPKRRIREDESSKDLTPKLSGAPEATKQASWVQVVKTFGRAGWEVARQRSSHVILEKEGYEATLSVPVHKGKNVKRGTLRNLIKDAHMTVDEFLRFI